MTFVAIYIQDFVPISYQREIHVKFPDTHNEHVYLTQAIANNRT